jgi:hypothetical protein
LAPEGLGRSYPQQLYSADYVRLDGFEIMEFSIKVSSKEEDGIFQLALAAIQCAFSKIQNSDCSAGYNRHNQ